MRYPRVKVGVSSPGGPVCLLSARHSPGQDSGPHGPGFKNYRKTGDSGDFKVSFNLTQNIFTYNIQDVSQSLVTSGQESAIKIQSLSQRNFVRTFQR